MLDPKTLIRLPLPSSPYPLLSHGYQCHVKDMVVMRLTMNLENQFIACYCCLDNNEIYQLSLYPWE